MSRVARRGLRVGRRQPDGVGFNAGRQRDARTGSPRASRFPLRTCASSRSTWAAASAASSARRIRRRSSAHNWRKQAKAPVKLMLDRKEEHLATGNRPSAAARIKVGVAADGTITAFDAESWGTGGAGAAAGFPLPYIYLPPNRRRTHKDVFINTGLQRPMRAPGHPQGSFITEMYMEELADLVKMDPVEFRIKNLPPEAPNAMWGSYLRQGAKEFGWDKRHPTGDPTPGPIKTGMGVAINTWGGGGNQGRAHVEISSDGTVVVRCGTQDLGTGTRTLVAVVAADTFGIPVTNIKPEIGDTVYPASGGSGGSTTAAGISPAIRIATVNALDALKEKVAPALGVEPASLVAVNGRIQVKDTPSKGMSWAEACKQIGPQPIAADGAWQPGLSSATTSGVQFAEVKVDIETGIVKVIRVLALQDCGLVVSRLTAESQVYGGVVGSLNFALFEDRILDRNTGQMVNPNMEWYLLAGMSDIPKIDVRLMDQSERGVIGIGEPPTVPTAAAVALAVRNAIGVTVRSLPLTPAKILQTLAQQPSLALVAQGFSPANMAALKGCATCGDTSCRGGHCESVLVCESRQRKGRGACAEPRIRKGDPARRRTGSAGADERLRHRARSHRQCEGRARRDSHADARRRAQDRRGDEDRRSCRARADREAVSGDGTGGRRGRNAPDPQSRHGRRKPESAAALLVLPERRVRLLQEGRQSVLLSVRRKPVPRDLRQRPELHRASVQPGGAVASPTTRRSGCSDRRASGWCRRRTTSRCRRCRTYARKTCSCRTNC